MSQPDVLQTSIFKPQHGGLRWDILFGSYEGVERFAVQELERAVQGCLPYVVQVRNAGESDAAGGHRLLVGTAKNNRWIAELCEQGRITVPDRNEGYAIACMESPWTPGSRVAVLAGNDERGVLYAVEDFAAHVVAPAVPDNPTPARLREAFDKLGDFARTEFPRIDNRGIWTWGYVVYDYRRFIDHMARLRMNMLTLWNDCAPLNAREIIEYAHSRGVRIVFGFHWGWGLADADLSNPAHRRQIREHVVRNYRENYQGLGLDGIYFQTLTEHSHVEAGGRSTAELACLLVNEIAAELYEAEPSLYVQFGLHATSIRDRFVDLQPLDRRIVIAWEDAGVLPYCYTPGIGAMPDSASHEWLATPESTVEYSRRLATFREGTEFAMCAKGWTCLRWTDEFEHHGPFLLGERDAGFVRRRLNERRARWDRVNSLWFQHYPLAAHFYREILACEPARTTVLGLIEDGLFEEEIQPSVALFAETLWNPQRPDRKILEPALSPYYRAGR